MSTPTDHPEWLPIATAPKNATEIRVKMADGQVHERAHWACDLSGSDQPPFKGWFIPSGNEFAGIDEPKFWMPITKEENKNAANPASVG